MAALATSEELCLSLIREFLAAKGFKRTLLKYDEENPMPGTRLISRQQLARSLKMAHILQSHDAGGDCSKPLIEVLVCEQVEGKPVPTSPNLVPAKTSLNSFRPTMTVNNNTTHKTASSKAAGHLVSKPAEMKTTPYELKGTPISIGSPKSVSSKASGHFISRKSELKTTPIDLQTTPIVIGSPKTSRSKSNSQFVTHHPVEVRTTPTSQTSRSKSPTHFVTQSMEVKTTPTRKTSGSKSPTHFVTQSMEVRTTPTSKTSGSKSPTHFVIQGMEVRTTPTGVGARHKTGLQKKKTKKDAPLPDFLIDTTDKKVKKEDALPDFLKDTNKKTKKVETVDLTKSTEPFFQKLSPPTTKAKSTSLTLSSPSQISRSETSSSISATSSNSPKRSPGSKSRKTHHKHKEKAKNESLLCEDVELLLDQEEGNERGGLRKVSTSKKATREPLTSSYRPPHSVNITVDQAQDLREVLFGNTRGSFNKEWIQQNLVFCDIPKLEFGLIQHKGGPCGVLAALQAHVIKHLLFDDEDANPSISLQPNSERRGEALVQAMAEIIWRAGSRKKAIVATMSCDPSKTSAVIGGLLSGMDIISKMSLVEIYSEKSLIDFLNYILIGKFMSSDSSGCICFTISVVLSKGIANIRSDMDDKKSTLIGYHNYCTQELVNLILTGYATSNVFDGQISLGGGGGADEVLLRGIKGPTDIGQLSLFEHYGSCKVGNYYKNPRYPIFVVCCESHFVVLFGLNKMLTHTKYQKNKFDLYFYDGLANQKDLIRLTVHQDSSVELKEELAPPIELCINTRWRSTIDWNGFEQLL